MRSKVRRDKRLNESANRTHNLKNMLKFEVITFLVDFNIYNIPLI